MVQLDKVYKAFSNLERDFARSKKTRTEFITDKFGGDISIGSFLILNALASEEISKQEDIDKLSFIRNVFDRIVECKNSLDSLTSFDFTTDDPRMAILDALDSAYTAGTGISCKTQEEIWKGFTALHCFVSDKQSVVSPLLQARYISICSPAMASLVFKLSGKSFNAEDIVEMKPGGRAARAKTVSF